MTETSCLQGQPGARCQRRSWEVAVVTRRDVLRRGLGAAAALTAGPFLAACAPSAVSAPTATAVVPTPAATLPPPETTSIGLTAGACDSAIFGAEKYLREEGFTDVKISDKPIYSEITAGNAQIGGSFPNAYFNAVENAPKVVSLGGLHPGCAEVWAQPGIASVKDLKGRTITVAGKTLANNQYFYLALLLEQAGMDVKDVNFVVQADADVLKAYLDGKSDAVFVATTGAAALKTNPANKGKMINSQVMD